MYSALQFGTEENCQLPFIFKIINEYSFINSKKKNHFYFLLKFISESVLSYFNLSKGVKSVLLLMVFLV